MAISGVSADGVIGNLSSGQLIGNAATGETGVPSPDSQVSLIGISAVGIAGRISPIEPTLAIWTSTELEEAWGDQFDEETDLIWTE
jgi:hypothetical protein